MLFKAHVIQSLYDLSDDQLEYQIVDRATFKRFIELKKSDKVPDNKTFWLFREQFLTEKDMGQPIYADSAYTGEEQEAVYKKKKVINKINEKGYRNKHLNEEQKANNKEKSRTQARVEHLFGFVESSMNGSFIHTIGITRARAKIGMMNLTYNICRCTQFKIIDRYVRT